MHVGCTDVCRIMHLSYQHQFSQGGRDTLATNSKYCVGHWKKCYCSRVVSYWIDGCGDLDNNLFPQVVGGPQLDAKQTWMQL